MPKNRQVVKQIHKIYQTISQYPQTIKEQRNWLLRTFLISSKQGNWANSGFILPTVAMVSLVVVLLTTAILFRSFERSKNASNVRVNEAVVNAATPALDRAKAKLNKLFADSRLPRSTPTDIALEGMFLRDNDPNTSDIIDEYTFGDEEQLKVTHNSDSLTSAWRFPVDTDNNGKYDTYTMYGIYFKNPPVNNGVYTRARNPLEARAIPMTGGNLGGSCGNILGTSATLVGNSGWFKIGTKLKKSFFVYTANIPITNPPNNNDKYEANRGNTGFYALEYQQERVQLPLLNNAVVYEDDLAISPGPRFRLNGRIVTNSNLLTGSGYQDANLYQISSKDSCFYEADNGKIFVGGNLGAGGFSGSGDLRNGTPVHLFKGPGVNPNTSNKVKDHKSVTNQPRYIAYNSLAYAQRIDRLVEAQMANETNTEPTEVAQGIQDEAKALGETLPYNYTKTDTLRSSQLQLYFQRRTRRIPFEEVRFGNDALGDYAIGESKQNQVLQGTGDTLRPPDTWMYPFDPTDGKTATNYAKLSLSTNSNKLKPGATEPETVQKLQGVEGYVGDRIAIGNNLPELWWDNSKNKFVGPNEEDTQNINGFYWDNPNNSNADNIRTRRSQIQQLADLGDINRNGDWELAAAQVPSSPNEPVGGLRVVTGAGIYLPDGLNISSTTGEFTTAATKKDGTTAWSDQLPIPTATPKTVKPNEFYEPLKEYTIYNPLAPQPGSNMANQPYLRMRATAVYHYKTTNYDEKNPKPVACVSSYYDPTDSTTARNKSGLPDVSLREASSPNRELTSFPNVTSNPGQSNNGVVYPPPTKEVSDYRAILDYQARLAYPIPINISGNQPPADHPLLTPRLVNQPLKDALDKIDNSENLTLAVRSAIDAALCALEIADGTLSPDDSVIPHGAIKEKAFLDARQIRQIHRSWNSNTYDLPKKDRQPLEIRTTVLDIDLLRRKKIGTPPVGEESTQEYILPNSGIIYASRNGALKDKTNSSELIAPVDFQLDPTRRPNGIMTINGSKLWRETNYRDAEKGFILVSNLPVYIYGTFNLHTKEEFTEKLKDDWSNFYSRSKDKLDPNFACRPGDPRLPNCTVGDEWRSAAVLSDAISLLSDNFRFGYRDEGDYDANDFLNNIPDIDTNAYVPQATWYNKKGFPKDFDTSKSGTQGSSYVNNFVTPIIRRTEVRDFLMESCIYTTDVSECSDTKKWTSTTSNSTEAAFTACNSWKITGGKPCIIGKNLGSNSVKTGSVAKEPTSTYAGYPRRIAMQRNDDGSLKLQSGQPIYYGVGDNGKVDTFPMATWGSKKPRLAQDSSNNPILIPWFEPQADGTFTPVLQVDNLFGTYPGDDKNDDVIERSTHQYWQQAATETNFNLIIAAKDTPARPDENNGGLHNFPRFLENWSAGSSQKARINGSFMQIGRSEYANGPFSVTTGTSIKYLTDNGSGKLPFYRPPTRQWGYDVGLLSQSPDLFAFKLVRIPNDKPDEYYREVGRNDEWVARLLCSQVKTGDSTYSNPTEYSSCN
ncbi:ORF_ID:tlr0678 unknown protein [Richelia intracellularis]|nr:ORF_ID:tlr0678 unknown protein [Richelia intracellularis]